MLKYLDSFDEPLPTMEGFQQLHLWLVDIPHLDLSVPRTSEQELLQILIDKNMEFSDPSLMRIVAFSFINLDTRISVFFPLLNCKIRTPRNESHSRKFLRDTNIFEGR